MGYNNDYCTNIIIIILLYTTRGRVTIHYGSWSVISAAAPVAMVHVYHIIYTIYSIIYIIYLPIL